MQTAINPAPAARLTLSSGSPPSTNNHAQTSEGGTPPPTTSASEDIARRLQHALQKRVSLENGSKLSRDPSPDFSSKSDEEQMSAHRNHHFKTASNMPDLNEMKNTRRIQASSHDAEAETAVQMKERVLHSRLQELSDKIRVTSGASGERSEDLSSASKSKSPVDMANVNGKLQELHDTLSRLRQDSEDQIQRLRQESQDATKTIEKLQSQLQQQSDYENLKREILLLKTQGVAGAVGSSSSTSSSSATSNHPSAISPNDKQSSVASSLLSTVTSASSPTTNTPSLEMLFALERAKALQHQQHQQQQQPQQPNASAAAAIKAFTDIQGSASGQFPNLGGPMRHHPLFPSPTIPGMEALGLMNEEMMAQWRRSLEQSPLGGLGLTSAASPGRVGSTPTSLPALPSAPISPPNSDTTTPTSTPAISGSQRAASPGSPDLKDSRHRSSSNDRSSPDDDIVNHRPSSQANGSKVSSEDEVTKSPIRLDSKSPIIRQEDSPMQSPLHQHFPNSPAMSLSLSLPLSVPPLMSTGRIPKSDPMEGRLQDMLRYNMEKYSGQALDTLGISRRVRELLSIHNIGQRLFAKYVLGLSQGTVSELLSKPKCWEKLTEKGRDSYRKMHAWAYDDNAVLLLKSLIPRKGELMRTVGSNPLLMKDRPNPSMGSLSQPGFPFPPIVSSADSGMPDERIAKFLNQANKSLKDDNPMSLSNLLGLGDENPHERMSKIYQEELARIMQGQRNRLSDHHGKPDLPGLPPGLFPGLGAAAGLFPRGGHPDLQRAMDIYQQELSRLQQSALAAAIRAQNGKEDEIKEEQSRATPEKNMDQGENGRRSNATPSPKSSPSSPNIASTPVASLSDVSTMDLAASLSPLQRMASITNSLVTQPMMPNHGLSQSRPNKAVLPPITQQQFDKFQHLNTDEVVRRIKEILSQYSISQRLFGESVLGLSQGSVSDLLARPKPWHMLTQKGREPFIRMKLFLDDENAVHKLVASQYKIAPEKLMRTGSFGGSHLSPHAKLPKLPDFPPRLASLGDVPHLLGQNLFNPPPQDGSSSPCSLGDRPTPILDPLNLHRKLMAQQKGSSANSAVAPSLYEMAALTHELDTHAVTTKVKEILLANNVGQKLFGEAVLGLSQGSVSELLSKPKPWHMLSIKGREPFIRMQLWLTDPQSIEKLQVLKNERRDGGAKRKRIGGSGFDSSSDRSSPADPSDFYAADSPGGSAKKQRILFSDEQKVALKVAFSLEPYPSNTVTDFLSQELNLEARTISNWFHNHRMRLKQQLPHGVDTLPFGNREGQGGFEPVKFKLLCHQRMIELRTEDNNSNTSSNGGGGVLSNNQPLPGGVSSFLRQFGLPPVVTEGAGLDLTFKRDDNDKDSIAASSDDEDAKMDDDVTMSSSHSQTLLSNPVGSRSRRKPAAPQWLRPEVKSDDLNIDDDERTNSPCGNANNAKESLTINGVCVMNSLANRTNDSDNEEETEEEDEGRTNNNTMSENSNGENAIKSEN